MDIDAILCPECHTEFMFGWAEELDKYVFFCRQCQSSTDAISMDDHSITLEIEWTRTN